MFTFKPVSLDSMAKKSWRNQTRSSIVTKITCKPAVLLYSKERTPTISIVQVSFVMVQVRVRNLYLQNQQVKSALCKICTQNI